MMFRIAVIISLILFISACVITPVAPIAIQQSTIPVDYLSEVQPILDKRCVSCHSCYNAACQAKFSSFEGLDRGATKISLYNATRLRAIQPTRLFHDATTTEQWREKGFYSLTQSANNSALQSDDILTLLLNYKMENPEIVGSYDPENETLLCPRDTLELADYFKKKPHHGMPYGFPALEVEEFNTLVQWISQGAQGPSIAEQKRITSPSEMAGKEIKKWEAFFNQPDAKHNVTARYLYEHLFLAHLNFSAAADEFYELIRSRSPYPEAIDEIATPRPFDDPKVSRVYYRFRKIHSTIVHKTHMVVKLDDQKLDRLNAQFIEAKWDETPHILNYDNQASANPLSVFSQIPARSRYQFLLDNSQYVIMTFIRGPVCRGQIALNVIHDHFWVMFQDPDYDISIQQPHFLLRQSDNLVTPLADNDASILKTFTNDYLKRYNAYVQAKQALYKETYPNGQGYDSIWKGNTADDTPILTIYRHFNSASVHKGLLGSMPRTLWVIDFPQFERIYYSLVAGFDVFGNVSHQTNVRRYMDFLRMEGETNFLAYMPKDERLGMFKSWYISDSKIEGLDENISQTFAPSGVDFKTANPKTEFVETLVNHYLLPSAGIKFDEINYIGPTEVAPEMPAKIENIDDVKQALKSLSQPGTGFMTYIHDSGINTIHIKITHPDGDSDVVTMVLNRWHDNVFSLFNEEKTLDSSKDTIDFIGGSVGSYINVFVELKDDELPDFLRLIKEFDASEAQIQKAKQYFISRKNPDFWKIYDWFQSDFNKAEGPGAGLYDLNRYYKKAW